MERTKELQALAREAYCLLEEWIQKAAEEVRDPLEIAYVTGSIGNRLTIALDMQYSIRCTRTSVTDKEST